FFNSRITKLKLLHDYDIWNKTHATNAATTEVIQTTVSDGTLNIDFTSATPNGLNEPSICAIEVLKKIATTEAQNARVVNTLVAQPQVSLVQKLQAKMLPNPSSNYFTLTIGSGINKPAIVKIYNAIGGIVEIRNNVYSTSLTLGSNYKPGVYFAEVSQGNEKVMMKFVKE
ncbi:T9SS type A sorting domain-containing protein, partial [Daejeonella sp.]|uniref:T9SS type A sorting domain-containing protein n=1 Tax=Daejeonella sp. TaxID=2805397 RepID=UPI0030C5F873